MRENKLKPKRTINVQIREDAFKVIEKERELFYQKHNIVASYCDVASNALIAYYKSKQNSKEAEIETENIIKRPLKTPRKPKKQKQRIVINDDLSLSEKQILSFLYYEEGMNATEVAQTINMSATTVRTAHRELKKKFKLKTQRQVREQMEALNVFTIYRDYLNKKTKDVEVVS